MCQKQPNALCCGCCTPKKVAASTAVIGGVILVASFVISAVLLTMLQDGLHNTVRYNSPRTDLKAYNDWLTSDPRKKSNGDAAAQYKAFYFFNVTNLDEIVAAGINLAGGQVVPIIKEIGPYYYRYWSEVFDVSWEGDDDRVTFQKYNRYDWQPTMSKMGGAQLDAYTDYMVQPSILYSTVFGNPFFPTLYGYPEYAVRVAFAGLAPLVYVQYSPTLAASLGYSSPFAANAGASTFVLHTLLTSQYLPSVQSSGITTTRAGFLSALPTRAAGCPEFEYWAFVDNVLAPQGFNTTGLKFTIAQAPYLGGFYVAGSFPSSLPNCPQMDFKSPGSIGCWISPQVTPSLILATTPGLAALFTAEQIGGLQQWLRYEYQYLFDFLWSSMGHLGKAYAPLFTSTCNPSYPSTNTSCPVWNTANAWVRQSVHNLLFENFHFFGPLLASALPTPPKRPMNIAYFHNRTSYADARLDKNIVTVGTGINNIADVDNLYRYWNGTGLPTTGGSAIFCTAASDPRYTLNGEYKYQTMDLTGQTFRNTAQGKMTKYSPQFPPGRVSDLNRYHFDSSVVDEKLVFDVWVSDIARHAHMTYTHSQTIKGIDVLRFTIGDEDYAIDPFFGQYHYALANYSCPGNGGPVAFSSIPRYGKLDKQELSSVLDLATIVPIPDATFTADGPELFSDPSDFTPSLMMEPISGTQIAGSLKVQFNLQYDPWIGMPKDLYHAATPFAGGSVPKRKAVLIPVYWQNKYAVLTDKQASTFKDTVYAAKLGSRVVLIVGSIVGGLLFIGSLLSLVVLARRQAYQTQTSKNNDLAL